MTPTEVRSIGTPHPISEMQTPHWAELTMIAYVPLFLLCLLIIRHYVTKCLALWIDEKHLDRMAREYATSQSKDHMTGRATIDMNG